LEGIKYLIRKALDKNHFQLANTLIERGFETDLEYCLFQSCLFNQPQLVKLLLEKGAKINHVDGNHDSCLALSVTAGHSNVVQLLLSQSAYINHRNALSNTPLITATLQNNNAIVRLLVDNGADVNLSNLDTLETALLISARQGNAEIVKILLDAGADTQPNEEADFSALFLAIERCHRECAELLINHNANIHIIDRYSV
jgi:ankyrin repeat protein